MGKVLFFIFFFSICPLTLYSSWEYKDEYDEAKADMEKAIENSAHAFNKKRSLALEIKQYEAQKREVEKFEEKVKDRRECVLQYLLWKLYHIEMKTNSLAEEKDKKYFESSEAKGQQVWLLYRRRMWFVTVTLLGFLGISIQNCKRTKGIASS